MKTKPAKFALALASAVLLTVTGCGGDGSSDSPVTSTPPATVTLSGVAATGAAFVEAVITVIDSTGAVVGTSAPVGADGTYNVTLAAGAKAPFVLVASRTTADGEVQSLVSVLESTTATTANVTPVTNLIASLLSASGDPMKLASELASGTTQVTAEAVAATVQEVKTILAPLLTATGTTATDPLKGTFSVDGTGYDRLLDSISISIIPASTTSANIEIGIKQTSTDPSAQPPVIQFSSAQDLATIVSSNGITDSAVGSSTISSDTLVASGTSALIADLLSRMTACFALPVTARVNDTSSTATGANVIASECRSLFVGDDPTHYLSNGRTVGRGKSFSSMFGTDGNGAVFDQGTYEFSRSNAEADIVLGYRGIGSAGNVSYDTLVARKDSASGKLKLVGNQYAYPGGVSAYHQYRQFITLSQTAYNYHSTGYNLNVNDVKGGTGVGNSIFDRVVVTTPNGNTVTLKPSVGSSNLNLVKSSGVSGTSYIRLRSVYADSTTTGDPSTVDTSLFFAATPLTDSQIAALPAQSVWRFDYYLAGNTGTTPDATQHYKTRARALTIPELRQQGLAQLSPAVISSIQTDTGLLNGQPPLPTDGPVDGIDFSVPSGALPVTQIKIFGRLNPFATPPGARFDDAVAIKSTERTGTVACTPASGSDAHCNTTVAGAYASGAYANGLHLWARDSGGREYANFYAMYRLSLP